ncbi:MAG: hypothetical protein ACAI35_19250 [Candidatus Methylacidiphilales bacterium]|nr:hypothetical protein [Candidatus Methylacidiphilales bacterium]
MPESQKDKSSTSALPPVLPPPPPGLVPLKPAGPIAWECTAYLLPSAEQLAEQDWNALSAKLRPRQEGRSLQQGKSPAVNAASPAPGSEAASDPAGAVAPVIVPLPLKIQGWYDGRATRQLTQWSNGKTSEKWMIAGLILEQNPEDNSITVADKRFHEAEVQKLGCSTFSELFWLQPGFYEGVRAVQSKAYYFYRGASPQRTVNSWDTMLSPALTAWIDPATRLPFATTDGDSLWIYNNAISAPAANSLTMPPAFVAAQQQNEKRYQKLIGRYKSVKPQ